MYDFDRIIDRRGTGSVKWNVGENELPMWVADMDFQTAPEILEAMQARLAHGVFGYAELPRAWYDAYTGWWRTRHGLEMDAQHLIFCTGVVPAISSIVRKLTTPNENVLVQTPVYNIFFNCIENNGRRPLESPLRYENGDYRMDFDELERKLADPQTSLMLLCNPHNPVGKRWDREMLARIGELAAKHHVTVLSDEIHCDLTDPGCDYVPFASVSELCRDVSITCIAPTKTFNIAGLQTAAVYVPAEPLHHRVWRGLNTDDVAEPNVFAVTAAVAALTKGGPWLDALREYLYQNKQLVRSTLASRLPQLRVTPSDATYLLWLDCSAVTDDSAALAKEIRAKTGLFLSPGSVYRGNGKQFLRWNIACPRALVADGFARLERALRD